jgi:hypothetical protein
MRSCEGMGCSKDGKPVPISIIFLHESAHCGNDEHVSTEINSHANQLCVTPSGESTWMRS